MTIVDAWGMPGSGKSALLLHAPGLIAAPNDIVLRYHFSSEDEHPADPDKQLVADYAVFQAFVGRIAEEIGRTLEPAEDSREARLIREFELAYDDARVSGAQISAKARVLFSIVRDSDVGAVKDSSALVPSVHEKRPRLSAALAKLLRGITQESPNVEPRRLLFALDDFELLPAGPLRRWIVELGKDLDSALVLLSRTPDVARPGRTLWTVRWAGCPSTRSGTSHGSASEAQRSPTSSSS